LGIECPSNDEATRDRWREGLSTWSERLRAEDVREPELIARELVEFRREFIGDSSKILNLGNTDL
jgi:hypothetical protein